MSDQQNLMTCPEPLELIDGVGPERVEARRRLETHARGCARCGPQLQALLQADQLLARQLKPKIGGIFVTAHLCIEWNDHLDLVISSDPRRLFDELGNDRKNFSTLRSGMKAGNRYKILKRCFTVKVGRTA